ncbi:hypothetical protein BTVI_105597 [Pitangus sulphuratus]|nr:hypothetical protein BTVI_105597 [Pitangus sulphuratus]
MASAAMAKEDEGGDDGDTLELYQQSLGELLLLLAAEPAGRRRELLHAEIQMLMARAECLKDQIKMRQAQSVGKEALAEPIWSGESPFPEGTWQGISLQLPQPWGYPCPWVILTPHTIVPTPSMASSKSGSPPGQGDSGVCSQGWRPGVSQNYLALAQS